MIDTVIFDFDGVVVDSEPLFYQRYQDFLAPYGCSFSLKDYIEFYCGHVLVQNAESIINRFNLPISLEDAVKKIVSMESKEIEKGIPLKPGIKELLQYLKDNNYKIVLATSSVSDRAYALLEKNNVLQYFDDMVFGPDVKRGKPYPDVFLKAAQKVNSSTETCLVLEDSEAGIDAAHSANIDVICIVDLKKPSNQHVDKTVALFDNSLEVIDYLKNH